MGAPSPRAPEEASTHLRSEVEEEGDAADDLAQPQPQEGHEHGAGGGCGLVWRGRRGRLRGVQGALVRGAGAAAAHLVGASQVLGVVSAGAAHGARPAGSGARLPLTPRFAGLPAANSKGGAGPARGQAGLDVGRSEPGAAPGRAGERAGRPAAPTLINLLARAGLGSQSALGEAACSTPTSGSPSFLSPSLSFLLSPLQGRLPPHLPLEEEVVDCSSGSRCHLPIVRFLFGSRRWTGEMQMRVLVKDKLKVISQTSSGSSLS